ncbi:hypothetical protein KFL_001440010 [Klebsormidium nitens]|uniref:Uncharacterized protein n=1 Tax=Klebsormidium nitens TaxID=105231 RepID=A0A1Y1HYP6_KLENI|nr:hypothetical protein KFL_001440010 [Klebsormidium nitens]|eukprot:GAQ83313.1 hypothetical protein KFL_001440010 [Klebsormidium nitens]
MGSRTVQAASFFARRNGPGIRSLRPPIRSGFRPDPPTPSKRKRAPTGIMTWEVFKLEKQYTFYGSFHQHQYNKAIHVVFVWPILFTAFVLLAGIPASLPQPGFIQSMPLHQYLQLNLALASAANYAIYYIILDQKLGLIAAAMSLACGVGANAFVMNLGWSLAWKFAMAVQIISWGAQFLGHGVFEGKRPALVDNLIQSIMMAPYFVLLESVEPLFGYEPSPGFSQRVHAALEAKNQAEREQRERLVS